MLVHGYVGKCSLWGVYTKLFGVVAESGQQHILSLGRNSSIFKFVIMSKIKNNTKGKRKYQRLRNRQAGKEGTVRAPQFQGLQFLSPEHEPGARLLGCQFQHPSFISGKTWATLLTLSVPVSLVKRGS